jgi:hypothetical protein
MRLRCAKPARQRLPPLLNYRMSVMMSRATSEPLKDAHELLKRPACAYREVGDHGCLAEAKMDAGGGRRRKTCSPCQTKGRQGYVRYVSYSWSMLSMWTSASLCCLGLAKVFCIVVGEECCGGSCCLKLKREASTTPAPLPSPRPPRAPTLLQVATLREGAETPWRLFGMVGARSSCDLHPKATLSESIRVL